MRLGVAPLLSGDSGGVYQYSMMVLNALRQPSVLADGDQVTLFVHDANNPRLREFAALDWAIRPLSPPSLRGAFRRLLQRLPLYAQARAWVSLSNSDESKGPRDVDLIRRQPELGRWFKSAGVDLMLYPVPMSISFESEFPFIFVVHDLQHRLQPQFPEVGDPKEWAAREYLFRNGVKHAEIVVADSLIGCEDVLDCYSDVGITPDRTIALPFVPPAYLPESVSDLARQRVRAKYGLPDDFFFYPAQFWPHKNHARLIEALAVLRDQHSIVASLVLCGSRNNAIRSATFEHVMNLIESKRLADQVHYLGFVDDEEMAALYASAQALLMPTFFGPTNIPILEAWSLGCPVMTSDIRGVREQAGDAALLIDPSSVPSLVDAMRSLACDASLRESLRQKGKARLGAYSADDFAARLGEVLKLAKMRIGAP